MKKIEAIIQPFQLRDVMTALADAGVEGMTVTDSQGQGGKKGRTEVYRGNEYRVDLLPQLKVEVVSSDRDAEEIVETISKAARSGNIGDGKIFVYTVEGAIRIRNGAIGEAAI